MSGIKHLSDIYKKQGSEFIDELFSKELTVSEKLNGVTFSFEKSIYDGSISYYKRDQENPISKIDRVLMRYYEFPISFIQRLDPIILDEIPSGWRFGMEFFINESPVLLSYQRIPKNRLVLTHIICKNSFGDIEKTIVEKDELEYWADLLNIEKPPIIFQGKLSDEQKVLINDFINLPYDSLKLKCGTNSFAKYLINILNPDIDRTALNDTLDNPIEGIVFRFGHINGEGDSFTAKVLDPVFADITAQNNIKKSDFFPSDIYGISIIEVMNYILDKGIESFPFDGSDPSERYLSFICSVFNSFMKENGEKYLGLDFQEPEFLKQDGFEANIDLINNDETKSILEEDESYLSLFKLILSAFRKIKKKTGGFFTQGAIEQFNILVREISEYLNQESVVESKIPTFDQFRKKKKRFVPDEETDDEDDDTEDINIIKKEIASNKKIKEPKNIDIISDLPVDTDSDDADYGNEVEGIPLETPAIDNSVDDLSPDKIDPPDPELVNKIKDILGQNKDHENSEDKLKKNDVNLVIGKFQPFNNGHLKVIKKAKENNNLPVILLVVTKGHRCFMDEESLRKMMSIILNDFSDNIEAINYIENDLLSTAVESINEKYNPITLTVGKKRADNYVLQSRSLKKRKKIDNKFQVQTAPNWVESSDVYKTIENKDYIEFKKKVPKSVHIMWDNLVKSYHK